jgi:Golgi phosphoprotein 3 (GPP34)
LHRRCYLEQAPRATALERRHLSGRAGYSLQDVLIAEDLLLLVTDDASGKPIVGSTELEHALAGGVLLELALSGRVDVQKGEGLWRGDRVVVVDSSRTGDSVLDEALSRIAGRPPRKPESVVGALRKGLRTRLYERLGDQGILRMEQGRVLGLFPTTRWPAVDSAHERQLRQALQDVLVVGVEPRPSTGAVVSLLFAIKAVPKVVGSRENRKVVQARAKTIAEGAWAATAVRKAVEAVNAATVAAVAAAAAAGGSGG